MGTSADVASCCSVVSHGFFIYSFSCLSVLSLIEEINNEPFRRHFCAIFQLAGESTADFLRVIPLVFSFSLLLFFSDFRVRRLYLSFGHRHQQQKVILTAQKEQYPAQGEDRKKKANQY